MLHPGGKFLRAGGMGLAGARLESGGRALGPIFFVIAKKETCWTRNEKLPTLKMFGVFISRILELK